MKKTQTKRGVIVKEGNHTIPGTGTLPVTSYLPKPVPVDKTRKDIAVYSTPSADKVKRPEIYREPDFDLERLEKEILQGEGDGFSRWLSNIFGTSIDRSDTERIRAAINKLKAKYELREEIIKFKTQNTIIEERLFERKLSTFQKKATYDLEIIRYKIQKAELEVSEFQKRFSYDLELKRSEMQKDELEQSSLQRKASHEIEIKRLETQKAELELTEKRLRKKIKGREPNSE